MNGVISSWVGTGLPALAVGVVLFWLRDGGTRRRRRTEIREDLELAALLEQTRPEAAASLNERIDEMLRQYLPKPAEEAAADRADRRVGILTTIVVGMPIMAMLVFLPPPPTWVSWLLGASVGVVVNVVVWIARRRRSKRDDAQKSKRDDIAAAPEPT